MDFGDSWSSQNSQSPLLRLGVSMDPLAMLFPGLGDWKVRTGDKLQGWVSKNIAKNDPFIKLERKYGPSHWFSELRPVSDWALEKPLDATALTVGAVVGAPYLASGFGSGAGGAGGAGMWEGAFSGTTGLSGATYGAAPASGIPGIAGTIGGSTGAAAGGLSGAQMAGLGATALGAMSPQQQPQQVAPMPTQRSGNRFTRAAQAFPGAISGALFPAQPGMDPSVSQAAQNQAMMAFAAGLLAGRDKPGASFGGALGNAYLQAQQSYGGAMDNAFRNTLLTKQAEREERAEDREVKREQQAQRQSAASTAGRLATGLQNSAGNMPGYWQMVASMPEVQGAVQELGLQPPTELDPGSWQQFQQKLAGAAQVGGPAAPRNPLQLKAIMGPQGKPILVREEQAEGMTPYYEPNTQSPSAPSGYRFTKSGALEAIPGGPADMGGPAGRKATQPLRKEFRNLQSVKDYETVLPLVESAKNAPDTGYGDLQLIYSVGKVLDPGSVVREGELNLTISAGSPMQRILGTTRFSLEQGGRLTPQVRQQILAMLAERVGAYEAAYNRDYEQYAQYAQEGGVDPTQVVGSHASSAYTSGAPKVGTVEGGYRFKGGDPSDPKNWEKQ